MGWVVDGGGVVGGFMEWVGGCWDGWLEGSWGDWWWGGWLEGSWGGWVCGGVGGGGVGDWRINGVGGCVMVWVVVGSVVAGFMGWSWWGEWLEGSWNGWCVEVWVVAGCMVGYIVGELMGWVHVKHQSGWVVGWLEGSWCGW